MRMSVKHGRRLVTVLGVSAACAMGLVACGSDDGNSPASAPPAASAPPPAEAAGNSVPASAGASVAAYIAYLRGLKTDETSMPVNVGGFVAPVDDSAAPAILGG